MREWLIGTLLLVLAAGPGFGKASAPAEPSQIFDVARLAVVMIVTSVKAKVTVPEASLAQSKIPLLRQRVAALVNRGQIPNTPEAIQQAAIQEIVRNPLTYLAPGRTIRSMEATAGLMGSGFIVTPDGTLVTNAHVVAPVEEEIKLTLVKQALNAFIEEDVKEVLKELGENVSGQMVQQIAKADEQYILKYMSLGKLDKRISVQMGISVPGVSVGRKGTPVEITVVGEQVPGKDVAVLKMENRPNLPTLPLGDDTRLRISDPIYVIGYPGAATFNPLISGEESIEPTLTRGILSRRATMEGGWTALQTDAAITHGNSGGPALDANGNVIGLATFGSINAQGTQEIQGLNFLVPASLVREFLSRVNVQPQPSLVTKLYQEAVVESSRGHYKRALTLFQQVDMLFPGSPDVRQSIAATQAAIMAGKNRSGFGWVWVAIGVIVLLAALGAWKGFPGRKLAATKADGATTSFAQPPSAKTCGKCGASLAPGQKYCGECAAPASS